MSAPVHAPSVQIASQRYTYQLICGRCGRRSFGSLKCLAMFPCACGAVCCGAPPRRVKGSVSIQLKGAKLAGEVAQMVREKKRLRAQAAKSVDRAPVPCPYASAFRTPATPRKESVGSVHFGASQNAAPQSLMDSPLANPKTIASAATNTAEDVWVNCDSCKKWRKMPLGSEIDTAKSFVCMLNNITCETPEEVCAKENFVYYNDADNGGLQRRLTTTPTMGEILSITTTQTMRGTIKVQRVGGVMCTEFNPGMWHKTNSLKCLLDGFASKEIISVDTKDGCKPMPFFTVNNKAFSHIQVHDPEQFYSLLCHYVTRSCLYMNKHQFSERPDGRIFNLFNDLGFKSRAENFLPAKSIKGKKDVYWWDLETWNVGKAARSASTERTKNLQPRLVPVDTDVFPFPFYDFGHTHSLDHEQVLIDDVMSSIRI